LYFFFRLLFNFLVWHNLAYFQFLFLFLRVYFHFLYFPFKLFNLSFIISCSIQYFTLHFLNNLLLNLNLLIFPYILTITNSFFSHLSTLHLITWNFRHSSFPTLLNLLFNSFSNSHLQLILNLHMNIPTLNTHQIWNNWNLVWIFTKLWIVIVLYSAF
jgi:hypothetical protein